MEPLRIWLKPLTKAIAIAVALCLFVLLPLSLFWVHTIDDSETLDTKPYASEGGSQSVAVTIALLTREVKTHYWTPNDPFFLPGHYLVRMPAFQRGIQAGLARFALALNDQLVRSRGSSAADPDVQKAVGMLNYPPDVWLYNPQVSRWLPTSSSEANYLSGLEALTRYNERLAQGRATFDPRSDNLMETLTRFAIDLGSSSALIDETIHQSSGLALWHSAEVFYETKGKMYAYYQLMHGLEQDFAPILKEKGLTTTWTHAMNSLRDGMQLNTFFVFNAAPDSLLIPNHLAAQGYYLMRARSQMYEIVNVLLK